MLWLYSNLKFMPQAEGFSTPWVLTSCVVTETLCTLTFFWLCSACKTRVYFCNYRVKRRNGELSNRWNCGLFWCHKFHKRVILDNRTQIHCIAKNSDSIHWFPVVSSETPLEGAKMSLRKCCFLPTPTRFRNYFSAHHKCFHNFQRPRIGITSSQVHLFKIRAMHNTPQVQLFTVKVPVKITFWFAYGSLDK